MSIIRFSEDDKKSLAQRDKKMAKAIDIIGDIVRKGYDDIFEGIVNSIVSQQLSGKVSDKIIERLHLLLGEVTPENITRLNIEDLRAVGLSIRKSRYISGVAQAVLDKELDIDYFPNMTDEEVIDKLISLDGIGEWTAQMLLIFALGRDNVLSYKDLGIRKGLEILYGIEYDFDEIFQKFSPLNTLASFYLWEISARGGLD